MSTEINNDFTMRGTGLGVASLVLGILAALGAVASIPPSTESTIRLAYLFAALGFVLGLASFFQGTRARSSAIAGLLLSVSSALFIGVYSFIGHNTTQTITQTPTAQMAAPAIAKNSVVDSAPESAWTPSYDCQKVSSGPERMICSNKDLSNLDVRLNDAYSLAAKRVVDREALKVEQIAWLKKVRNNCSDADCMKNAYRSRIGELESK